MNVKTIIVSQNRQVAIPSSFGIKPGEKVRITIDNQTQTITIQKLPNPVEALFGIAKELKFSSIDFLEEKHAQNLKRSKKLRQIN